MVCIPRLGTWKEPRCVRCQLKPAELILRLPRTTSSRPAMQDYDCWVGRRLDVNAQSTASTNLDMVPSG